MKPPTLLLIIATLLMPLSIYCQSIRTLSYNTSNNVVIVATNSTNALTFGNAFAWSTNTLAASTRANLGFNTNLNTLWSATNASNARSAVGLGWSALTNTNAATALLGFTSSGQVLAGTNALTFSNPVSFLGGDISTYASGITSFGVSVNFEERRISDVGITNADVVSWSSGESIVIGLPLDFSDTNKSATTRQNLGMSLSALTNTSNVTAMRALAGSTNTNEPYSGTVSLTNTNTLTFSNGVLLKIQ